MKRFSRRRLTFIQRTFLLYLLVTLLFAVSPPAWTDPVRHLVLLPVGLFQRVCVRTLQGLEGAVGRVIGRWDRADELETLRRRLTELEARLLAERNRRLQAERRLEQIGALPPETQPAAVSARLVAFSGSPVRRIPRFNRGILDGVRRHAPVFWNGAVVGRVLSADLGTCRVALVGDHAFAVAVRCDRTRVRGILKGLGGATAQVKYVGKAADVRKGDIFVTSGLDGIFPPGRIVARCTETSEQSTEIHRWIEVEPVADIDRIETVAILVAGAEGERAHAD
jgi:rod shape-determining protein MreC